MAIGEWANRKEWEGLGGKRKWCPICNIGNLKEKIISETFNYKGKEITIDNYKIYVCDICEESIVDAETLKSSGEILKQFKTQINEETD